MLGATHLEAVRSLRNMGEKLGVLICDGYDPALVPEGSSGSGPVATIGTGSALSSESIERTLIDQVRSVVSFPSLF